MLKRINKESATLLYYLADCFRSLTGQLTPITNTGGIYMTPGRLSLRSEFTQVRSHGSTFVYMTPQQNVMPARVILAWFHPDCCTGERISLRYEISQRNDHKFPWWNSRRCEFSHANTPTHQMKLPFIVGFHMTSLKLKLKNYRSYRDFTLTMH